MERKSFLPYSSNEGDGEGDEDDGPFIPPPPPPPVRFPYDEGISRWSIMPTPPP